VWGEGSSGFTVDRVYFLTDEVCQIVFGLPVGGAFTQSEDTFDVYERHTLWRVLAGTFVAANPETGEVHRLRTGDSLAFRGDVWHHGFAAGAEPVLVVEFTAPPPTRTERLVERRALPARPTYGTLDTRAPEAPTARAIPAGDRRWTLEGTTAPALVGEIVSTPTLTVAEIELRSGQRTDCLVRTGAETAYVLDGTVGVELPEVGTWLEAGPRDGVYLPAGTPHRLLNVGAGSASVVFQVVG
jgi:quercetin dioxygenase-like cupin family protein